MNSIEYFSLGPVSNVRRRKLFRIQCRCVHYYTHTSVGRSIILFFFFTHRPIHHRSVSESVAVVVIHRFILHGGIFFFLFCSYFDTWETIDFFWSITNGLCWTRTVRLEQQQKRLDDSRVPMECYGPVFSRRRKYKIKQKTLLFLFI